MLHSFPDDATFDEDDNLIDLRTLDPTVLPEEYDALAAAPLTPNSVQLLEKQESGDWSMRGELLPDMGAALRHIRGERAAGRLWAGVYIVELIEFVPPNMAAAQLAYKRHVRWKLIKIILRSVLIAATVVGGLLAWWKLHR